jgi:SAM-dependent methyltransferase
MPDLDPRLVALYDADNPDGPDHDFFRAVAAETGARSVIDLGCGTGLLTVTLAGTGRSVVGVDPSRTMLAAARARPGAEAVTWLLGDSSVLPPGSADLAVMSGNVAQHIGDPDWSRTLADLHRALRRGGTLVFESRNPAARAWRAWSAPERTTRSTADGPLEEWTEAEEVAPGVVELTAYNHFVRTGERIVETQLLHFRDRAALERDLGTAGFTVTAVHGDWQRGPVTDASAVLVVLAVAR